MKIKILKSNQLDKKKLTFVAVGGLCGVLLAIGIPQLRLVAVHNDSLAIIENTEEGTQDVFELGNDVFTDGNLLKVEPNKVVVLQDGKEIELALKAGVSVAETLEEIAAKVPNLFRSSEEFKTVPLQILSARTAPVVRNNEIVGFVINEVSKDSILAKWGLAQNDVIQSVGGVAVIGAFEAIDAIRRSDGKDISIEFERNGEKKNIKVG